MFLRRKSSQFFGDFVKKLSLSLFPYLAVFKMSSTVRVFVNEKRIATGKTWKGQFLQVYPAKKTFNSEGEWRTAIYESLIPTIKFISVEKKTIPKKVPAAPAILSPIPVKPAKKAVLNPESEDEKETEVPVSYYSKDWNFKNIKKMTLPSGTYYIGDLCYALDDHLYDRVFGQNYDSGYYVQKGNPNHMFMMQNIDDGLYRGSDNCEYSVDAGIIGIASESVLDPKKRPYSGGKLFTFKGNVSVDFRKYGKFCFYSDDYTEHNLTISNYDEDDY
jgi:hypothetical protein